MSRQRRVRGLLLAVIALLVGLYLAIHRPAPAPVAGPSPSVAPEPTPVVVVAPSPTLTVPGPTPAPTRPSMPPTDTAG